MHEITDPIDRDRNIGCKRLDLSDYNEVVEFMFKTYSFSEPVSLALSPTLQEVNEVLELGTKSCLESNTSIAAYDNNSGELIAVVLSEFNQLDSIDLNSFGEYGRKMFQIVVDLNRQGLPDHIRRSKFLTLVAGSVRPEYSKQGVTTKLAERSKLVAMEFGCEYITVECTSLYSQAVCRKLGYTLLHEIKYLDYSDEATGEKWYASIREPHRSIQLFALKVKRPLNISPRL
nr:uncharacterized protein LOC100181498 [Ciona intestinalis]|eukprot:XP_018668108.1 uncharacterized protein LOC100181498 [Ciona intestinalis]